MKSSPEVTFDMAIQFWLYRWSGMNQHDIAAMFGVNQGRVSEVLNGHRQPGSENAARMVA
ncbi:helix-turn-helix transcriptional regulator [Roseibacterium beibuensis]|uniref:HTH cro/C1-type domain-containing protein n=1 Tax=[Roseibacterium] beibuensis TaxID=1193142 RepID=A0ABP9L876_9RHOB|nr:helix-turn-helix transcriptional regulator [Roseibacterium beibuensis]MCS6624268.1 helix-turn-helix transcriptional regulator [Roseibacterium beibuensis]